MGAGLAVGCWNQGLVGQPHGVTVIADPVGGLPVIFPGQRYAAYAGVTVGGPQALSSISSR